MIRHFLFIALISCITAGAFAKKMQEQPVQYMQPGMQPIIWQQPVKKYTTITWDTCKRYGIGLLAGACSHVLVRGKGPYERITAYVLLGALHSLYGTCSAGKTVLDDQSFTVDHVGLMGLRGIFATSGFISGLALGEGSLSISRVVS